MPEAARPRFRSLVVVAFLGGAISSGCERRAPEATAPPERVASAAAPRGEQVPLRFVGRSACAQCHDAETQRFRGSHHDDAMTEPTAESVKGDFKNSRFSHSGETVEFLTNEPGYSVRVSRKGETPRTLPVRYTFGVSPLQQYLIDVGNGRLQALSVAWDTRPKEAGGQRWFHLRGDQKLAPGHPLHWESPDYNWNAMCAACHSTGVVLGYDRKSDGYKTEYSEVDVSCEACHGAGSRHVAWAEKRRARAAATPGSGFERSLVKPSTRRWVLAENADIAHVEGAAGPDAELETCAPCHSRRSDLGPGRGDGYHDRYRLAHLEPALYYPDGQIRDEVFEYGSFLQSKMYARGVVCSDCHEPHSLKLRAEDNALCSRCHRASHYDVPSHHFHAAGSAGAACVSCHMPERTYMVVDRRRDHRIGVPRPALAAKLSAPNPCTGCHAAKSAAWAEEEIRKRHPAPASATPTWGEAFLLAREEKAGAAAALSAVFGDTHLSSIVRASALHALTAYPSAELATLLRTAASDADPLMRRTAADVAASLPPAERPAVVWPLLKDPARSARIAAAQALLELPPGNLGAGERTTLASAVAEYVAALEHNADRAEALADLAELARRDGRSDEAERLLTAAIRKDPSFAAAHLNLADLYRERGDEQRALTTLRTALEQVDERPAVRHALGLALVRQKRSQEALVELRAAHEAAPLDARFGYVYAVALFDSGSAERALEVLEALRRRRPDDAQVLRALVDYSRRSNRNEQAEKYARELGALTERR